MTSKFYVGRTVITRNAPEGLTNEDVQEALGLHAAADWGEVCPGDRQENKLSLREGFRLLSV